MLSLEHIALGAEVATADFARKKAPAALAQQFDFAVEPVVAGLGLGFEHCLRAVAPHQPTPRQPRPQRLRPLAHQPLQHQLRQLPPLP